MKKLLLFVAIISMSLVSRGADPIAGYIVKANNDTVRCNIVWGRQSVFPFTGISVIDENGKKEWLSAKSGTITAFGFVYNYLHYDFLLINPGTKQDIGFYQRLNAGPKYQLYGIPPQAYAGNPIYVLFNSTGTLVKFEPCIACPWRKQLREFLKDDSNAFDAVETAPRINIPEFVKTINKI